MVSPNKVKNTHTITDLFLLEFDTDTSGAIQMVRMFA